jgi:hypothetical protein
MTNEQILGWIKRNLGPIIQECITTAKAKNAQLLYTEDWLAAICCRETGGLIARYPTAPLKDVAALMRGDYTKRATDPEKTYHGFGFWQADIASFPAFVRSGDWKDPKKACSMAIAILEGKRIYLQQHFPQLAGDALDRAITAAYNYGEGNVGKALHAGDDIDSRTAGHDYSKAVWAYREIYNKL